MSIDLGINSMMNQKDKATNGMPRALYSYKDKH